MSAHSPDAMISKNLLRPQVAGVKSYSGTKVQDHKDVTPSRPPPPIIGKVTHHTIELYWDEALTKANYVAKKGDGRVKVCVQEKDKHGGWAFVYTGYAKKHVMVGLEPWTEYVYRIRFEQCGERSEWSPSQTTSTTKEPLTGEHLHKAIVMQDFTQLEKVLESGDLNSVDTLDKYGFTCLMQTCQKGSMNDDEHRDFIETLVKHGADVNYQNESGKTALMLASYAAKREAIKEVLYHGASLNPQDRGGSTALHWAMDSKNTQVVDCLLEKGANVDATDYNGWTPLLRCAAINGDRDCANVLIRNGANINKKDKDGKTALMIAVVNGHRDLVELLCEHSADISIQNEYGKTAYEMAIAMERRMVISTLEQHMDKHNISYHH